MTNFSATKNSFVTGLRGVFQNGGQMLMEEMIRHWNRLILNEDLTSLSLSIAYDELSGLKEKGDVKFHRDLVLWDSETFGKFANMDHSWGSENLSGKQVLPIGNMNWADDFLFIKNNVGEVSFGICNHENAFCTQNIDAEVQCDLSLEVFSESIKSEILYASFAAQNQNAWLEIEQEENIVRYDFSCVDEGKSEAGEQSFPFRNGAQQFFLQYIKKCHQSEPLELSQYPYSLEKEVKELLS